MLGEKCDEDLHAFKYALITVSTWSTIYYNHYRRYEREIDELLYLKKILFHNVII